MIQREITVLTDIVLITCIVQRGVADDIIQAAREAGAQGATVYFARGMGIMYITPLDKAATFIPPEVLKKFS